MIALEYRLNNVNGIDWNVKFGVNRILQNIVNLLNTFTYEVAYMRTMGLTTTYLDSNITKIQGSLSAEVADLIDRYEPRAKLKSLKLKEVDLENLNFEVVIEI